MSCIQSLSGIVVNDLHNILMLKNVLEVLICLLKILQTTIVPSLVKYIRTLAVEPRRKY